MAGASGRHGSVRAAAFSIKGPGFVSLVPGAMLNRYEGRAMLSVSEAYPPSATRGSRHKAADHRRVAASVWKAHAYLADDLSVVGRVLGIAEDEKPGPVHLDLADPESRDQVVQSEARDLLPSPDGAEVEKRILAAKAPILLVGSPLARARARERSVPGCPVATTAAAKGLVDEGGPFALGVVTGEVGSLSPERAIADSECDLVVWLGAREDELVRPWPPTDGIDLLAIPLDPREGREAFDEIAGTAIRACESRQWGREMVERYRRRLDDHLQRGWQPGVVYAHLEENLDQRAVVVVDTGLFCTTAELGLKCRAPDRFLGSSVARFMGASIPTAIGVALSEERPVLCLVGDGGIAAYAGEIRRAVDLGLPIVFALLSDGELGSLAAFAGSRQASEAAWSVPASSWVRSFEALDCPSARIESSSELASSVGALRTISGPAFLEFSFDPSTYQEAARPLRWS